MAGARAAPVQLIVLLSLLGDVLPLDAVSGLPCAVSQPLRALRPLRGGSPMSAGAAATASSVPEAARLPQNGGAAESGTTPAAAPATPVGAQPAATLQDLLSALGGGGTASAKDALKPSCREDTANFGVGMARSMRAMAVFNEVKGDYEKSLANITDAAARAQVLRQLHERSAPKALKLARENGGLYNKAAQFVASLQAGAGDRGIPKEYVDILSVLTDKAPGKPFSEMAPVLEEEFGKPVSEVFKSIEETPLAAASLAQVHRAELHDGTRVAVKIIYPLLRKEMSSDFAVLRTFGASIKPAGLDLTWLLADFEKELAKELDFENEARNSEATARKLAHLPRVKVPKVFWEYTRKSVLTMELEESLIHLSDADGLRSAGLDPADVGSLIADTFAEMALCHGHVHGDPHAGNIYVRTMPRLPSSSLLHTITGDASAKSARLPHGDARMHAEIVLLDFGCVHILPEEARVRLCNLVLACVERRSAEVQQLSSAIAGPLHRFLPLLLSPSFALTGFFDGWLSTADLRAAARQQIPSSVSLEQVGQCVATMHSQGGNFLGVLHSMGYTRGLLSAIGYPERLRLQSLARFSVVGLLPDAQRVLALGKRDLGGILTPEMAQRLKRASWQVCMCRETGC